MQDRYAGDIGDYCKLGLLRALAAPGLSLAINWYTTEPVADKPIKQNDGNFTGYCKKNENCYKEYDEKLYGLLTNMVNNDSRNKKIKHRNIASIEKLIQQLIENLKFYANPVPEKQERQAWHKNALDILGDSDMIFLDPDNGIETENDGEKPKPKTC